MVKKPVLLVSAAALFILFFSISCSPTVNEVAESTAPELGPVIPYGPPEIHDLEPTSEVVSNCGGLNDSVIKHPSVTVGSSHTIEWMVGGNSGIGFDIGSDLLPAKVNLNAALEGAIARDISNIIEQTNAWDLPAEPGYIMEYTLMWREVWQPGYIDVTFPNPVPEIIRIDVKYRTGIQSEIIGQNRTACEAPTTLLPTTAPSEPAATEEVIETIELNFNEFRLCNKDAAGSTFAQTNQSTGITRIEISSSAQVFFISTNPATITFSPDSGLSAISSNDTAFVILGKEVPGLTWIEIDPGFSYTACIFSLDQFARAKSEADYDMSLKKGQNVVSEYYFIDGQNIELVESFP